MLRFLSIHQGIEAYPNSGRLQIPQLEWVFFQVFDGSVKPLNLIDQRDIAKHSALILIVLIPWIDLSNFRLTFPPYCAFTPFELNRLIIRKRVLAERGLIPLGGEGRDGIIRGQTLSTNWYYFNNHLSDSWSEKSRHHSDAILILCDPPLFKGIWLIIYAGISSKNEKLSCLINWWQRRRRQFKRRVLLTQL